MTFTEGEGAVRSLLSILARDSFELEKLRMSTLQLFPVSLLGDVRDPSSRQYLSRAFLDPRKGRLRRSLATGMTRLTTPYATPPRLMKRTSNSTY